MCIAMQYHNFFYPMDRYFTPFIANKKMSSGERRDILPENNEGNVGDTSRF